MKLGTKFLKSTAGSALLASAIGFAPGTLHAQNGPPSVAAVPSPDVYSLLAQKIPGSQHPCHSIRSRRSWGDGAA